MSQQKVLNPVFFFQVTYISPFPYKNAPPTLRTIDVSKNFDIMPSKLIILFFAFVSSGKLSKRPKQARNPKVICDLQKR